MYLIKKHIDMDCNIFLFGDLHIGSLLFSDRKFNAFIDAIHKPYDGIDKNYAVCHGDLIEAIKIDDPRYDPRLHKDFVLDQVEDAAELLAKLENKLLVVLQGNHEWKLWRSGDWGAKIVSTLNEKYGLDVGYGGLACKIAYYANDKFLFKHYAIHGRKLIKSYADDPERRESNEKLILKRHLKNMAGDCLLMSKGHTHKLIVAEPKEPMYLADDGRKIVHKYVKSKDFSASYIPDYLRWYVNTGTFHKTVVVGATTYAEVYEMEPVILGYAVVRVRDGKIDGIDKVLLT